MLRRHIKPFAIWLVYHLWSASWRKTVIEHPSVTNARRDGRPLIFGHWHGDEYAILHLVGRYRIATMTSTSRDGEIIDSVIRRLGGTTSRGSSTRASTGALRGLVRFCRRGHNASMALDGPRGPIYEVKPGVFYLARLAGGAIVPVGVASSAAYILRNSWNKARIPWPFARVFIYFGPVTDPPPPGNQTDYGEPARRLADATHAAGAHARERLAGGAAADGRQTERQ